MSAVNFRPFLHPDSIRLELETRLAPNGDLPADFELDGQRNRRRVQEELIQEMSSLLDQSGAVSNQNRIARDLLQREKQTPSGIGQGVAIPHVRTLQARSFTMAFGRSAEGLPWETADGEPIHLVFAMAAPPHDDRTYLKVYQSLARALLDPDTFEELLSVEEPGEILRILKSVG